ncbi:MAG TPA: threonine--tRNA ligase [Candidatus Dormibacteraeota bacterium]|nr:threonine--tRNA ligase [Candidatus Dormibacteraeota bacterium]
MEEQASDHRRWLRALDLAHFDPASPGMPYWLPPGVVAMRALQDHWRRVHERWGYQEVSTPLLARDALYESSGHLEHFAGSMFFCQPDEGDRMGLKPVNCPGSMVVFRSRRRSHRELPLRLACYDQLHRHELSGVLSGLLRVQSFRQDDAHLFVTPDQVRAEVVDLLRLAERLYAGFDLRFRLRLGGPPAGRIGDDATWQRAQAELAAALDVAAGPGAYEYTPGEGAFYGPKVDLLVEDGLGRDWQMGTFQLDYEMPRRLGCRYVGPDGAEHVPAVIHRALLGSFERFLGVLLEQTDGHLPPFMAPVQLRLVPVAERHLGPARALAEDLGAAGLRVEVGDHGDRVAAQVREAWLRRVPFLAVLGDRELAAGTVALRTPGGEDLGAVEHGALRALLERRCAPPPA